jgi:hypothetical protein
MQRDPAVIAAIRRRMGECEARRLGTCGRIDIALGFDNAIDMETCDGCYARRGPRMFPGEPPNSPSAIEFRQEYIDTVIGNVKKKIDRQRPTVILTVMGRHMDQAEREATMLRVAPRFGRDKAVKIAADIGGETLAQRVDAAFANMSERDQVKAMAPTERWSQVKAQWAAIEKEPPAVEHWSLIRKGANLVTAVASGKHVTRESLDLRSVSCHGVTLSGERMKAVCPSRLQVGKRFFCGDCGCGERDQTCIGTLQEDGTIEPDNKLFYTELPCPRRMPGFSNAILTIGGRSIRSDHGDGAPGGPAESSAERPEPA